MIKLLRDDCNKAMIRIKSNTIDTIITDPPYGMKFMSKKWDYEIPSIKCFERMLRIAKPGAFLLCFGGTRTYHRMTCNIEDAGWQIRDCIMWLYGSGFPKSHNIGKKLKGWNGWGTSLKPAFEPIIVAMKPNEGTYANNALVHGVSGLNIDGGRIGTEDNLGREVYQTQSWKNTSKAGVGSVNEDWKQGRWPANIILDKEAGLMLDKQTGILPGPWGKKKSKTKHGSAIFNPGESEFDNADWQSTNQGASRFFYCAKASKKERNLGLKKDTNKHPTVKPLSLMRYLCKLTRTPTGGLVLDPFMGTATTGLAYKLEGRHFIGIESDTDYYKTAKLRIRHPKRKAPKHDILAKEIFKVQK